MGVAKGGSVDVYYHLREHAFSVSMGNTRHEGGTLEERTDPQELI